MSAALDRILERLDGVKRSGVGYVARCPAHEDHHQSLSLAEGHDGRALLTCHAGCSLEAICNAMEMTPADLFEKNDRGDPAREIVAVYDYTDEAGELLYQQIRFEPKTFRSRRLVDGQWRWSLGDVRRVLFRLPKVIETVRSGGIVFVVEGEKDVLAIERVGAVATCNLGGAGKWRPEYGEALRGADVVVVADKDKAGRDHAASVAASLATVAASVRVVEAAEGKDAFDHLAAGHSLDDLVPSATPGTTTEPLTQPGPKAEEEAPPEGDPPEREAAHAEVLTKEWRNVYRWAPHEKAWRRWTGAVWKRVDDTVVVNAAQKVLRKHYGQQLAKRQTTAEDKRLHELHKSTCHYGTVQLALAFLKGEPGFHTEFEEWDEDPYTVNCADGLLDMRTQTLRPHDPTALCTKMTRWSFGGADSSGAWERHLRRCLPDDDVRRQVQRDLGRALVGADLEESLPIWHGTGANGKTTTARAIRMGVDGYGKQAVKDLLVASRFERHTTDLADLAGSRIVFAEEVQDGKCLDEATVKTLTGGNRQKARFMRGDNFEFEQTFSITLLVNHKPVIKGTDRGIWRRVRLVPWTVSIPFAEQRPQEEMVAELMADGPWMLRWMVEGFADWQADHHWVADAVKAATAAYEAEQDVLAGFLGRRCTLNPHATVSVADLHEEYTADALENGDEGIEPLGKIAFGNRLKSRNFTQDKATGGVRVWRGIGLVARSGKNSVSSTQGHKYNTN